MVKVVLIGADGMLGQAIQPVLKDLDLFSFTIDTLDITCAAKVHRTIIEINPDYIINCAAYTAVDLAESESGKAFTINATAVQLLASVANFTDATLIHFSTDYVFDGKAKMPYQNTDKTRPINVYGRSKLVGEQAIATLCEKFYIFRISWLYAAHGKNFFRWVAESDQQHLKIVDTQIGSPTSAHDVAHFIKHVLGSDPEKYGLYHFVNQGEMSWFAFAKAINEKLSLGKKITAIQDFPTAAERPAYSVMDCTETIETFNFEIPTVGMGLNEVIRRYEHK
jgi:dTDP-4-dehydrorhamnose reductase